MRRTRKNEFNARRYPLTWPRDWPRMPKGARESGHQFTQTNYDFVTREPISVKYAHDLLRTELMRLKAANVVIPSNYRVDQYGFPIENHRDGVDQGVAVYFTFNGQTAVMACDRYAGAAANMRSLSLAIEAMRQLGRHGGGAMMDRAFAGFAPLPRPPSCWDILGLEPGASKLDIERAFRERAKKVHPDAGGDDNAMAELNIARDSTLNEIAA